jgi:hypothetical protein
VHRLDEERRCEPFGFGLCPAERDHVGGDITAVDVESCAEKGNQEAAGPARDVERRLTAFDVALEVGDLRAILVELGPPLGDEAVVPRLRQ